MNILIVLIPNTVKQAFCSYMVQYSTITYWFEIYGGGGEDVFPAWKVPVLYYRYTTSICMWLCQKGLHIHCATASNTLDTANLWLHFPH